MPPTLDLPPTEARHLDCQADQLTQVVGEPLSPTSIPSNIGRYEVAGEIARGGMGSILKGRDPDLNRDVAIKVLLQSNSADADLSRRFLDEARIAGQLQHPGIVPVYELGKFRDGCPYFTMKLVQGQTLATLLFERNYKFEPQSNGKAARPPEDLPRFLKIFEQICQTIAYAHSGGVIHRDLKPANIMVGNFGEVQVMDWGLAKVLAHASKAAEGTCRQIELISHQRELAQTIAGQVMGTPAYMAPEQARSEPTDERADVFGLGAILCEMLTGRPPFKGVNTSEVVQASARGDLREARHSLQSCGVDPELVSIAHRCLEANRADRPRDAGELARTLTNYLNSVDARLRQAEMERAAAEVRAAAERKNRKLSLWLATSILGVAVVGSVGWYVIQRQSNARRTADAKRDAELRNGVSIALFKVADLQRLGRYREARGLLEQSDLVVRGANQPELERQVQQAFSNLALIEQLEGIRLKLITPFTGPIDFHRGSREYAELFRAQRFGASADNPEDVAERIRQSPVRDQIVAGLDDWCRCASNEDRPWILAVARNADPNEWRDQFRDPKAWTSSAELERLARTAKIDELSPASTVALGHTLALLKGDATAFLSAAQKLHPDDFWINITLAYALQCHGDHSSAISYYRVALALRPGTAIAHGNLGSSLHYSGQSEAAIAEFQKAIAIDPSYHLFHQNMGTVLRLLNRLPEALAELKKAVDLNSEAVEARIGLGEIQLLQNKVREAEVQFRKAIEIEPENARAKANLGEILFGRGKLDEAASLFTQSANADPGFAPAHLELGLCLYMKGKFAPAIDELNRALKLDPKSAKTLASLGAALQASGKSEQARAAWVRALELDPNNVSALSYLGVVSAGVGQYDEGLKYVKRAVELAPNDFNACYSFGQVLGLMNSFTEARTQLRRGMALLPPNHPQRPALERIASIYENNITLEQKLPQILKGDVKPANATEQLQFARLCYFKQEYQRATQFFADGFAASPRPAESVLAKNRFLAACAAAMAASSGKSTDAERVKWRKQAVAWLQDQLDALVKQPAGGQSAIRVTMQLWQNVPDLKTIRDPAAIANLSAEDRSACDQLWSGVAKLLK